MATVKISGLNPITSGSLSTGTTSIPIVHGGTTFRVSTQDLVHSVPNTNSFTYHKDFNTFSTIVPANYLDHADETNPVTFVQNGHYLNSSATSGGSLNWIIGSNPHLYTSDYQMGFETQGGYILGPSNTIANEGSQGTYGTQFAIGWGNIVGGRYGNMAVGAYNYINDGQGRVSIGYNNYSHSGVSTLAGGGVVGDFSDNEATQGWTFGSQLQLNDTNRGGAAYGFGNATDSSTGNDEVRIYFGLGSYSYGNDPNWASQPCYYPSTRQNGMVIRMSGEINAEVVTTAQIDDPFDESVLVTKEWCQTGYTVATLPTTGTLLGRRTYVTDSTVVASGNFGATVIGGGANTVPVFYDGTNWIIA